MKFTHLVLALLLLNAQLTWSRPQGSTFQRAGWRTIDKLMIESDLSNSYHIARLVRKLASMRKLKDFSQKQAPVEKAAIDRLKKIVESGSIDDQSLLSWAKENLPSTQLVGSEQKGGSLDEGMAYATLGIVGGLIFCLGAFQLIPSFFLFTPELQSQNSPSES